MGLEKVLVLDTWGDYAHFMKIETTTSPLTYSLPTGTALSGFLAGISGLERDSYYELFSKNKVKFAVRILNPVKKVRINQNLVDTSKGYYLWDCGKNPRTQAPYEYLKDPKYRIYVGVQDETRDEKLSEELEKLLRRLKTFLKNHKAIFTPYLGTSEFIANFSYVDEFNDVRFKKIDKNKIHSAVKKENSVIVEEGKRYMVERIPLYMDKKRVVQEYADVLFETRGRPIKVKSGEFYLVGSDNVIFL